MLFFTLRHDAILFYVKILLSGFCPFFKPVMSFSYEKKLRHCVDECCYCVFVGTTFLRII
jgi:hypothetical protein